MIPLLAGPALAGSCSGSPARAGWHSRLWHRSPCSLPSRSCRCATCRTCGPSTAAFDRIAASDGALVLVEISPHRDMDSDPVGRSVTTPFDVHFEGLLPDVAGQRFYAQMWDGWVWNVFRGEILGAGTFKGQPIDETPPAAFVAEMRRWGIRHLFVWTEASRSYLARNGFAERWREGLWSDFELLGADTREVVTTSGSGRLTALDSLGGTVSLAAMTANSPRGGPGALLPGVARLRAGPRSPALSGRRTARLHRARRWLLRSPPRVSALPLAVVAGHCCRLSRLLAARTPLQ